MNETKNINDQTAKPALPPHLIAALAKHEAKQKTFGFSMVDVTPSGYGPSSK
jgi:hypothetical protein